MTAASFRRTSLVAIFTLLAGLFVHLHPAQAQVTAFVQSVAEAAAKDRDIAEFYRANKYQAIWTDNGSKAKKRRAALLRAIQEAPAHGLPAAAYDTETLEVNLRRVKSERQRGQLEVAMSKLFLEYARDLQTGVVDPRRIDSGIVREVPHRSRAGLLKAFAKSSPQNFLRKLPPSSPEYARLMKEKLRFEKLLASGGWGPEVQSSKLELGNSGAAVVQLRNRLMAMGYLKRTSTSTYDERMRQAVARFQRDHGLVTDGVAGSGTLREINRGPARRLLQIIVAMERERWTNMPRGKRHIWVNITDYQAKIIDNGKVTFQTKSVVGHTDLDRRTPEFSDVMEYLVINPTWNVPRSIATKEYLPLLQQNPNAVGHLRLVDARGRVVRRDGIDFSQFDERTFPFDLKEPPSQGNALGLVKFMFPNRHNIYLHDTPAKRLFGRETRAFSHGCVRLNDPFDFAYELLSKQERDPQGFFRTQLNTRKETFVNLKEHVPVHIVYRTAFTQAKGATQFRRDVYGRDAKIWKALENAGVTLRGLRG